MIRLGLEHDELHGTEVLHFLYELHQILGDCFLLHIARKLYYTAIFPVDPRANELQVNKVDFLVEHSNLDQMEK